MSFAVIEEYEVHTFSHFNTKTCSDCNVRLVQICDDWFETHTLSNCQNNNHIHSFNANRIENGVFIKEEPPAVEVELVESIQSNELINIKTDIDSNEFEEIFTANLDSNHEIGHHTQANNTEQLFGNSSQQFTYKVVNISVKENGQHSSNNFKVKKCEERFQCRFCDKIVKTRFRLDTHIQSHHNVENQTKCKHCNRSFQTFQKLDNHLKRCNWNDRKRVYMKSHPHQPAANFECDICGSILKKYRTLADHMNEVHSSTFSFKCRICARLYPSRYYLAKHLNRHKQAFETKKKTHIVDLDEDLMERRKYVRNHPHRPQMDFNCDICGKAISRFDLLEEHMSTNHSAHDSFQCRICSRVYPNR